MPAISTIKLPDDDTIYDVKDATARTDVNTLKTTKLDTDTTVASLSVVLTKINTSLAGMVTKYV